MPSSSTSTQPHARILSIQVCRGLAALLVLFAHLDNVEAKYFPTHFLPNFQYGVSGVDLFFVISGFVISLVTVGKFQNIRNATTFLYHRLARIFPIYWIYTFIVLIAFLYNPHWINAGSGSHVNILRSFLLIPDWHSFLIMQGWTLSYELFFYLVFFLILLVSTEKFAPWILLLWGALTALLALANLPLVDPALYLVRSPLVLEFLTGCLIFHLYRRSRLHPLFGVALLAVSLIWLAVIIVWTNHHHGTATWIEGNLWARLGFFGSFAALFLLGALELERTGLIRFSRPLIAIGDWSYSIYLSHLIIVELIARTVYRLAPRLPLAILFVAAVAVPASLFVGYLSYTFLEVPITTRLYKRTRHPVPHTHSA